jgi:putative transposase
MDNHLIGTELVLDALNMVHRYSWPSRGSVRVGIFEYAECFYDPRRKHSSLGHLSPIEYEQARLGDAAVA